MGHSSGTPAARTCNNITGEGGAGRGGGGGGGSPPRKQWQRLWREEDVYVSLIASSNPRITSALSPSTDHNLGKAKQHNTSHNKWFGKKKKKNLRIQPLVLQEVGISSLHCTVCQHLVTKSGLPLRFRMLTHHRKKLTFTSYADIVDNKKMF